MCLAVARNILPSTLPRILPQLQARATRPAMCFACLLSRFMDGLIFQFPEEVVHHHQVPFLSTGMSVSHILYVPRLRDTLIFLERNAFFRSSYRHAHDIDDEQIQSFLVPTMLSVPRGARTAWILTVKLPQCYDFPPSDASPAAITGRAI